MTQPDLRPLDDAVKAMLAAATDRPGDLIDAPAGASAPWWILERIDGGNVDGSVAEPGTLLTVVYQVTSVGTRHDQAVALADRVRRGFLELGPAGHTHPIAAAGLTIVARFPDWSGPVQPEGSVFNAIDRYRVTVST